ncbi:hypothetical protein AND_004080 [Anopheles darlingi]|uniref:ZAD domain-containing protein n=1 Tax=Anopheles darlingi TaxID=43151 RepID=W5JJ64_ANODA|nr:hypothetical protein AND_004080 [Anopheles darlingi]
MGDLGEVLCWGFICRLCSKMHRDVMFITDGSDSDLMDRINAYLPVSITPTDPLPKTICGSCNQKIKQHHQLMEQIQRVQQRFQEMRDEELAKMKAAEEKNGPQPSTSAMNNEAGPSCSKIRPAIDQGLNEKPPKRPRLPTDNDTQGAGSSAIPSTAATATATARPSIADCNVFLLNDDQPGPSRPRASRATTATPTTTNSANISGSPNDCGESSGIPFKQHRPVLAAPTPNTDDSD